MINAGTIAAYLTLSTADFNNGISDALGQLAELRKSSEKGAAGAQVLEGAVNGAAAGALTAFGVSLASSSGQVGAWAGAVFSSAQGAAAGVKSGVSEAVQSLSGLDGAFAGAAAATHGHSVRIADGIVTPLSSVRARAQEAMISAGDGMVAGLRMRQGAVVAQAAAIASAVAAKMRSALGIASPSRVMREIGAFAGDGFVLGLNDMRPAVKEAAGELASLAQAACAVAPVRLPQPETRAVPGNTGGGETANSGALCSRLDELIELVRNSEQSMKIDGRSFGKLVREYS